MKGLLQNLNPTKLDLRTVIIVWLVIIVFLTGIVLSAVLPKKPQLSRAALAKEVVTAYNIPKIDDSPRHFRDVDKRNNYYDYIETAYFYGLIEPQSRSYFGADKIADDQTRQKAMYIASKLSLVLRSDKKKADIPSWVKPEVEDALDKIVKAYSSSSTAPMDLHSYDTIPNLAALAKARTPADQQASKKITAIEKAPDWFASAPKLPATSPVKFTIRDDANAVVVKAVANTPVNVAYKNGVYVVAVGNEKFYSGNSQVKLTPDELPALVQFPGWKDSDGDYNKFRGNAIITYSGKSNKLWAVNELLIEDYLKGIREGSVSDTLEYLKSLTVASRSYAYFYATNGGKHAGEPFHLKNSRNGNGNDQVYAGFNLEKNTQTLTKSIEATSGEVITHNGKVVIAPFSSGTDGIKTRDPQKVWGRTDMPWVQVVPDPHGKIPNWATLEGNHMVGFSAQGARGFINKDKKTYDWTLKYYFKDISIKKEPVTTMIKVAIYSVPPA